jgi:hypothetical protein
MRQLVISSVARNLVTSESGMPAQWDKALRNNGQLAVDIIIAMQKWNLEKKRIPDARQDSVKPILEESEKAKAQKQEGEDEDDQDQEQENDDNDNESEEAQEGAEDDDEEQQDDEQENQDDYE